MMEMLAEAPAPPGFETLLEPVGADPPQAVMPNAPSREPTTRRMSVPSLRLGFYPGLLALEKAPQAAQEPTRRLLQRLAERLGGGEAPRRLARDRPAGHLLELPRAVAAL